MKFNRKILLLFLSLFFTLLPWLAFARWQKKIAPPLGNTPSSLLQPLDSAVDSEVITIIKKRRGLTN